MEAGLFTFLPSVRCEFLLRGVSVRILIFVTLFLFIKVGSAVGEFNFGRVAC